MYKISRMLPSLILAALPTVALGAPPRPPWPSGNPSSWVTHHDYPSESLRNGEQGIVAFRLAIGPDGFVQNCTVTEFSGFVRLDALVCPLIKERARFRPATDAEGRPTTGTYSNRVRWMMPGKLPLQQHLAYVESYFVETDGSITGCKIERMEGISDLEASERKSLCDLKLKSAPYRDEAGKPVRRQVRMVRSIEVLPAPEN